MKKIAVLFLFVISKIAFAQPGSLDPTFNPGTGANNPVETTTLQSDGKIIIGGDFSSYNGISRNGIARINADGSLDGTFNPGTGANGDVFTITLQSDGKIIIGGWFTSYNGVAINRIARINADGSLDGTFNPGTGTNSWIKATTLQADGKIIIVGAFTTYNGTARNRIARINADGSLDGTFNPGTGANNAVETTTLQADGKIIIGGNFTTYNGTVRNRIARINADGSLDGTFNPGSGASSYVHTTTLQSDGKIIIVGAFTTYNGTARNRIARINADGSLDGTFNPGTGANNAVETTTLQADGKIIIGGNFSTYNGTARKAIARINADGTLDSSFNPGSGVNGSLMTTTLQPDGKIIIGGDFSSYNGISRNGIARINAEGIFGYVYNDINQNCINDNDAGISGRKAIINPGNIVVETNQSGYWYLDSLPSGTYTITADTSGKWRRTCALTQSFTITNPDSFYLALNFGFVSTTPCAEPEVSVNMPRMRPGFSNQQVYVQACNEYKATGALYNGYVELELDPLIIPQSASQSYTSLGGNKYKFVLTNDTLNPGQCENIIVYCSLSNTAVLNSTLCVKANLYPADSCVFDTIPNTVNGVTPCTLPWDKSSLKVTGKCINDSIRFVIYNTGQATGGNMQCYAPVRVYVDGVLISLDSIMLAGGDSAVYTFLGDGRTWRLEADQHPLHPGNSHPNATVENCNPGSWTPGLVNVLPQDDADGVVDIYCGVVTGSYDPNDKTGYPLGVDTAHNVLPNQQMEYMIRFQNTGTDTAFTVVIRDTLDMDLDIFSVVSGVSSHKYNFKMYGPRILEWTFNNILLPDSNVNEAKSHGFVTFTVEQNRNLANGTLLENTAGIYFDYNAPVITNTTVHTVNDQIITKQWNHQQTLSLADCESVTVNGYSYTQTGSYYQVHEDTLFTINATINNKKRLQTITICAGDSITVGTNIYSSTGIYTDVFTASNGCDSTVTTNLTVNAIQNTQNVTICLGNSLIVGTNTYSNSGTYTDVFTASNGCDSTVITNLTVYAIQNIQNITICLGHSLTVGTNTYSSPGTYTDIFTTSNGCDSTVITNLTLNTIQSTQNLAICVGESITVGANIYNSPGTYTDIFTTSNGCDSIVTTNLTFKPAVNTAVTQNVVTLAAHATAATYQWLDCTAGYTPINGQTGKIFTATANGEYAVIVTQNGCSDTSACYTINKVGLRQAQSDMAQHDRLVVYPNPAKGQITVSGGSYEESGVEIYNVIGIKMLEVRAKKLDNASTSSARQIEVDISDLPKGMYVVKSGAEAVKLVIE